MARRVFLHVGSPKTGTTFLQQVLWSHREGLRDQRILLPGSSIEHHFRACLDVREVTPPGAWRQLTDEINVWDGDAVISHELFAPATAQQVDRALGMLDDATVHVVVTARDLVRQIPAEWQEHLKHRQTFSFPDFVHAIRHHGRNARWFWRVQDIPEVLDRWGHGLPRNQVHVVTVPAAGAAADDLWKRFADLVGIDSSGFDLTARTNSSVRAEQAELLRQFNLRLGDRLPMPEPYAEMAKDLLAHDILAGRPGTRFGLLGDDHSYAVARSKELVAGLERLGVDVVGSLQELVPGEAAAATVSSDAEVSTEAVLDESIEALAQTLQRFREHRERERQLRDALAEVRAERDRLRHAMQYRPIRHLLVAQSQRRSWLHSMYRLYITLRSTLPARHRS